jgi:hypothetical protein
MVLQPVAATEWVVANMSGMMSLHFVLQTYVLCRLFYLYMLTNDTGI